MSLSKDEIRSIAVEVAQIVGQSATQTTGQSVQADQTSTSTTNRSVDMQIEDVHADASLKANVALDQSIETIRKNLGGDLSNAYGYVVLGQLIRHQEEVFAGRMRAEANERVITVKALDLQDSATTIPK